jgi:hypothetical protein
LEFVILSVTWDGLDPLMYPSAAVGIGSVYRRSTKALSASSFCAHRHRPSGPIGIEFRRPLAIGIVINQIRRHPLFNM